MPRYPGYDDGGGWGGQPPTMPPVTLSPGRTPTGGFIPGNAGMPSYDSGDATYTGIEPPSTPPWWMQPQPPAPPATPGPTYGPQPTPGTGPVDQNWQRGWGWGHDWRDRWRGHDRGDFRDYMRQMAYHPPGYQAPQQQYNYQPNPDGSYNVYPPGVAAPSQYAQVSSPAPVSATDLAQSGAATTADNTQNGGSGTVGIEPWLMPGYSGDAQQTYNGTLPVAQPPYSQTDYTQGQWGQLANLPNPQAVNARNYSNMTDYAKQLLWAAYEARGWDPQAAQQTFEQSLPRYAGPRTGSFANVT